MSISSQLLILNQTKGNIKTSINNKGVTVTDEAFAEYPDKVRLIPNGGGIYESNIILWIEGSVKNAVIPSGTTEIGHFAFYFCTEMEKITIPDSVTVIENEAFSHCYALDSITLPPYLVEASTRAFEDCTGLDNITFPSTVTTIGAEVCDGCTGLTAITCLATTPPTLGTDAFRDTNNCPIYVPSASVLAYQTATEWMEYASRITAITQ